MSFQLCFGHVGTCCRKTCSVHHVSENSLNLDVSPLFFFCSGCTTSFSSRTRVTRSRFGKTVLQDFSKHMCNSLQCGGAVWRAHPFCNIFVCLEGGGFSMKLLEGNFNEEVCLVAEACPDCPDCADSEISCRTRQPASKRHCKHGDKADEHLHFSCVFRSWTQYENICFFFFAKFSKEVTLS